MRHSIAQTKIIVPRRRPDILSRSRLLDLLHELLDHKLILAVAPAGYGKTSLFVDFAQQAEIAVCWYSVDERDREPSTFFRYFTSALVYRFPQLQQSILASPEDLLRSRLSTEQLVTVLVNELYEHVKEHFLLVLDDYHLLDGQAQIDEFVSQFVQLSGDNCHLALLSRKLLTLSDLPLMIARAQAGGLSFEELRFHKAELQALMQRNYRITLSEGETKQLLATTEGWITGLLLSSPQMGQPISAWERLARASGVDLYSYLAEQVLNQQPPQVRHFLLYTSLLKTFNVSLCEAILADYFPEEQRWQDLLDSVIRDNLFVLNVGEEETWLRYHHLFQEFLEQIMLKEHPKEAVQIRRRLAIHYETNQEWEEAYAAYQKLNDTEALVRLILQSSEQLLEDGRFGLLGEWLDALPAMHFEQTPALLSLRGIVEVWRGRPQEGLAWLDQAIAAQRNENELLPLAQTFVRRSTALQNLGDYQKAMTDAEQALALTERYAQRHGENDRFAVSLTAGAHRLRGLCYYMMGKFSTAMDELEEARHRYARLDDQPSKARVTLEIATAHMGAGHYQLAAQYFRDVLKIWRDLYDIIGQANVLNNLGVLYHLQGEYEQALDCLVEALSCARRSGYQRMEAFTLASIGDLFSDLNMPTIADEFYEQAYPIARAINERFLLLHLNLAMLLLALPLERSHDAKLFLDAAGRLVSADTSPFEHGLFRMAVGQFHLMGGRNSEAIVPLEEAVASLSKTEQRVEAARAHLFLAAARHDAGDRPQALQSVSQTFRIASELEDWHPLVTAGNTVSKFLETFQSEEDCKLGVERLLREVREFSRATPQLRRQLRQKIKPLLSDPSKQRPQLYIRTLGRGEVFFNGRLIEQTEWQTQTAKELFFYFLAEPEGVTKEEVGGIFWPDATPGQIKTRFKNAIYRLRNALFPEVILYENDLYFFDRTLDYEYDVEMLEDAMATATSTSSETERRKALQRVVDLYKGPYLPDMHPIWAQLERERIWRIYVEATLALCELQLQENEVNEVLAHCHTLLATDPCLESAHRMAMRAYAKLGNRADVARQYEQCQTALLDEFGIPPSPETEALYDQLMA